MPGYQYGAPRRPAVRLVITPEMEAQIEKEIGATEPRKRAASKASDRGLKTTRAPRSDRHPCGTRGAYFRHMRSNERPCEPCTIANREYRAASKASRRKPRELKPCGTTAAYQRHLVRGEKPCEPCAEANRVRLRKAVA
ncbi:hypothetical protein [Arthrobacter agilis]|uniref:hypothetical protein n=1 Tax=Arthrobacter agilis TaxID=37921 RepID=UPI002780758C|nr:hypothetical protein [Arthrobacter agilis]MDQ0735315.1 hypothetical protein [Arthrobacter agilis]